MLWRLVVRSCMQWITRRRWLWVRMLRWKLGVLKQGLLIRRLLVQRLPLVQKLRKLIEDNVALRKFMFQTL